MKRLCSLDAMRGLAALAVVLWHWQHFFALTGDYPDGWQRNAQPFYLVLRPFYDAGWMAVDLFFVLSGYVFFWLYRHKIRDWRVTPLVFAKLRFSRLYPLHLATLLIVAALEARFHALTGQYFIFQSGDWRRFAAAVFMAQQWLPPTVIDFSFNGPAWSVSIEVLLYIVFFAVCRFAWRARLFIPVLVMAGLVIFQFNSLIGRGLIGFFTGGAALYAAEALLRRADTKRLAKIFLGLALLAWAAVFADGYFGWLHGVVQDAAKTVPAPFRDMAQRPEIFLTAYTVLVCPVTVIALVLYERTHEFHWNVLSFLGDISYSVYLLHFPLQLACVLVALKYNLSPMVFMTPLALSAFFLVLIGLGAASHYWFERPAQRLLRGAR